MNESFKLLMVGVVLLIAGLALWGIDNRLFLAAMVLAGLAALGSACYALIHSPQTTPHPQAAPSQARHSEASSADELSIGGISADVEAAPLAQEPALGSAQGLKRHQAQAVAQAEQDAKEQPLLSLFGEINYLLNEMGLPVFEVKKVDEKVEVKFEQGSVWAWIRVTKYRRVGYGFNPGEVYWHSLTNKEEDQLKRVLEVLGWRTRQA